jgi:RNA polymerase sigma-70 factor (ECF subfamily)
MKTISDLEAFNRLFTEYQGRFIRFAYNYVRDSAVAEDFTIEALLYYWENRHLLAPGSNIPAYILTIIKHKCLNYLEHIRIQETATERMKEHAQWELRMRISTLKACDPDELFTVETQKIIHDTLCVMPERSRHIFIMSRYHNKSHKEIASALNISTKTVEFHIAKVLKALRHNLRDYIP